MLMLMCGSPPFLAYALKTVTFLRGEFEVELTHFTICGALEDIDWSKKAIQSIAQERNPDLRDKYIYNVSSLRSNQLVF